MFVCVQLRMYDCIISSVRVCVCACVRVVAHACACMYAPSAGACAQLCESMMYILYACMRVLCVCMCVNACVSVNVYV